MLEANRIYCGDCVELMKEMDDDSIDLTVTSPPYDNLRDYKGYVFRFEEIAKELFRIIKQGGVVVWVVGDATINGSETGTSFKQALGFKDVGFNLHDTMIYKKGGMTYPSINRYYQSFEYMFILSKGVPKSHNLIKDKHNKWAGSKAHWGKPMYRNKNGDMTENKKVADDIIPEFSIRENVWEYSIGKGNSTRDTIAYQHPAQFPEKLAEDHILSWGNEGDLVFDPMCGSGTTPKMAYLNKRRFIGIDISQEYCNIAKERLLGVMLK